MNRRDFLLGLGSTATLTAAGLAVPAAARRIWQVPANAPVPYRGMDLSTGESWSGIDIRILSEGQWATVESMRFVEKSRRDFVVGRKLCLCESHGRKCPVCEMLAREDQHCIDSLNAQAKSPFEGPFRRFTMPLVRRVMPQVAAQQIIEVEPMPLAGRFWFAGAVDEAAYFPRKL